MIINFEDVDMAFDFASAGQPLENQVYLNILTGEIHIDSELYDNEEELPKDLDDEKKYILLPHKNDLDLGKPLAINFSYEFLLDDIEEIKSIFHTRRAYSKFKDFLEEKELLDKWYDYECKETEKALREWCAENEIKING